jgi:ATP-dependent Lhr-like helicase
VARRRRRRNQRDILRERPDVLLTTPESLQSMLVSASVDHRAYFAELRVVVIDELHAFAGDDRGWHLLTVLERRPPDRPARAAGRLVSDRQQPLLSSDLAAGSARTQPSSVVTGGPAATTASAPIPTDVQLDYVAR